MGGPAILRKPSEKGYDMNDEIGKGGSRWRRGSVLAIAMTGAALLAAGCSSSSPSSGAGNNGAGNNNGETRYQQAVAYAKCVRQHGFPSFPDPTSNGAFPNNGNLDLNSPQLQTAENACKNLEPAPNTSQYQQGYQQLLKYSACMRSHGVPNYPDPVLNNTGVSIPLKVGTGSGEVNTKSSQFTTAEAACQSLQPGGGNGGGQS
jgi:hypothetical protein